MKYMYKCEYCGKVFSNNSNAFYNCYVHELACKNDNKAHLLKAILDQCVEPCSYCSHAYFVYNCERECKYKECCDRNNWENFEYNGE